MAVTKKDFRVRKDKLKYLIDSINEIDPTSIGNGDTDSTKVEGFVTTRNAADSSMYVPVAATSGYERGFKVAYAPVSNDGGYFDSLYVNTKVASTSTPGGELRAIEAKTTIEGNCAAGAVATALYAKVNVSGASAEVSQAYGIDILLEEESSGTITAGTGIRVQGGAGAIHYALDVSGDYGKGAINMPYKSAAGVTDELLASSFGVAEGSAADARFMGLHKDTNDSNKVYPVYMVEGQYLIGAALTAAS
jgi:hypothetical protein